MAANQGGPALQSSNPKEAQANEGADTHRTKSLDDSKGQQIAKIVPETEQGSREYEKSDLDSKSPKQNSEISNEK